MLAATAAGLGGVLSFHTPHTTASTVKAGGVGPLAGSKSTAATAPGTAPASGSSGGGTQSGAGPTGSSGGASSSAPSPSGSSNGTAAGALEQYGYGELNVTVTVSGGHITAVNVPTLKTADSYSQQIAVQVIPMLRSEVLKAQSTKIYAITGATYTSEAYATSVQSALDKLHFK